MEQLAFDIKKLDKERQKKQEKFDKAQAKINRIKEGDWSLLAEGKEGKQLHEYLSDREFEVMRMIASGGTVVEIAKNLSLSVKTISTYRTRILKKLGIKNNVGIMPYAMGSKLVN